MHDSAMASGKAFIREYIKDKSAVILDVGSQDVNGSLRSVVPPYLAANYIGVDMAPGRGVDVVMTTPYVLPFPDNHVDVVVSTSCLEHCEMFWVLFLEMLRVLKTDGLCYLNVPLSHGYHRYPVDCWRFFPDSGMALQNWGRREGYDVTLLESFSTKEVNKKSDFISVFGKGPEAGNNVSRIHTIVKDVKHLYSAKVK